MFERRLLPEANRCIMNNLFDPPKLPSNFDNPIAHSADPSTSHEAARNITRSGKRGRGCEIVLALVKRWPSSTAIELFELATDAERRELKEAQRVRQRLTDLLAAGLVKQGMTKICSIRNSRMVTWEAT